MPAARGERRRCAGDAKRSAERAVLPIGQAEEHTLPRAEALLKGARLRADQRFGGLLRAVELHAIGVEDVVDCAAGDAEVRPRAEDDASSFIVQERIEL